MPLIFSIIGNDHLACKRDLNMYIIEARNSPIKSIPSSFDINKKNDNKLTKLKPNSHKRDINSNFSSYNKGYKIELSPSNNFKT